MREAAFNEAFSFNRNKEGRISWMYLDIKGLVTIGVGCQITLEEAVTIPFFHEKNKQATVTKKEIAEEYNKLRKQPFGSGIIAQSFAGLNDLRISESTIDKLITKRIQRFDQAARAKFPGYDSFPADAQLAINSYLFATGHLDALPTHEPRLHEAIQNQDWWRAAAECSMSDEVKGNPGLAPRNDANRRLFANAGRVISFELPPETLYLKNKGANKSYLFGVGGKYARYDWDDDKFDFDATTSDLSSWKIPADYAKGVKAIFNGACNGFCDQRTLPHTGKTYFVNGSKFWAYDWQTGNLATSSPQPLSNLGLTGQFTKRVDAVVRGQGLWQNKLFFFSGDGYVRYDLNLNMIDWGPEGLASWKLPKGFETGIDAAVNGEGPYLGFLYIFKGQHYVRYSWGNRERKLKDTPWVPDPNYIGAGNMPRMKIVDGWAEFGKLNLGNRIIGTVNAGSN